MYRMVREARAFDGCLVKSSAALSKVPTKTLATVPNAPAHPRPPTCLCYDSRSAPPSPQAARACDASRARPRGRVRRQCRRNTSARLAKCPPDDALLGILSSSSAARKPPADQQRPAGASLAASLAREAGLDAPTQSREMVESERRSQFQRQIHRKWQAGDVYSPTDLSGAEQKKWKFGRKKPQSDAFDVLGINPVLEYKVRRPSRGPTGAG
jgi:hypothetical protein